MIAIAAILLIVSTVNTADAEPIRTIQGGFDEGSIVILIDGIDNAITLNYDGNTSYHYDGKLKTYNSGGFVIKNIESGIVVFAHPIGNEQYRLVLLTEGNIHRLIGVSSEFTLEDAIVPSYDEPVSSVGADITKYDVPDTLDRDSGKDTFLMALKPAQTLNSLYLGDKFEFDGFVYNVRNLTKIVDADFTLEISRDDLILRSVKGSTDSGGTIHVEIGDMTYPIFYPKFCYDVIITTEHEGYTHVFTENFVMKYSGVWNPDMSWMNLDRWNYLPNDFRDEPRTSNYADTHCN